MFILIQLDKPGRLDTNSVPTLQNTADVMDFCFDPFNPNRLAVGKCNYIEISYFSLSNIVLLPQPVMMLKFDCGTFHRRDSHTH